MPGIALSVAPGMGVGVPMSSVSPEQLARVSCASKTKVARVTDDRVKVLVVLKEHSSLFAAAIVH
jgi:hypothetical protein